MIGEPARSTEPTGADPAEVGDVGEIAVFELRLEPGRDAREHVHEGHRESLFVVAGALTVAASGREQRAQAGAWAALPAGLRHAISAAGPDLALVLELHTPSGASAAVAPGTASSRR